MTHTAPPADVSDNYPDNLPWYSGDPLMEDIADTIQETCHTVGQLVQDNPRNIAAAAMPVIVSHVHRLTETPLLNFSQWTTVRELTDWLDRANGRDGRNRHELAMRFMKIIEEAGEAFAAYIGMVGQNPRKGITHNQDDVEGELCDVVLSALVALASLTDDPAAVLGAKLRKVADRAAVSEATA